MTTTPRQKLVLLGEWLVQQNAHIGYPGVQPDGMAVTFRPMPWMGANKTQMAARFTAGRIWYPDCSAFVTWCFKHAGFQDPNGLAYNGFGNSQIMWDRLGHYTNPARAQVGALVVFGATGENHVCFVTQPGINPQLCSHGSAAGPILVSFSAECDAHAGQAVTLLDVSRLL